MIFSSDDTLIQPISLKLNSTHDRESNYLSIQAFNLVIEYFLCLADGRHPVKVQIELVDRQARTGPHPGKVSQAEVAELVVDAAEASGSGKHSF